MDLKNISPNIKGGYNQLKIIVFILNLFIKEKWMENEHQKHFLKI